jgi:hypothetical protein
MNDLNAGGCIGPTCFPQAYVTDETGYTVRVDAPKVGAQERNGGSMRLLLRAAYFLEDADGKGEQIFIREEECGACAGCCGWVGFLLVLWHGVNFLPQR